MVSSRRYLLFIMRELRYVWAEQLVMHVFETTGDLTDDMYTEKEINNEPHMAMSSSSQSSFQYILN